VSLITTLTESEAHAIVVAGIVVVVGVAIVVDITEIVVVVVIRRTKRFTDYSPLYKIYY
jgi:hypothetical protein